MSKKMKEALIRATEITFSEMAFMDVMPSKKPEKDIEFSHIPYISFTNPYRGGLALYLSSEAKRRLTENIHGRSFEELSLKEIDDCLLEILNVLAGNFFEMLDDKKEVMSLSLPELIFDRNFIPHYPCRASMVFDAEGAFFMEKLFME